MKWIDEYVPCLWNDGRGNLQQRTAAGAEPRISVPSRDVLILVPALAESFHVSALGSKRVRHIDLKISHTDGNVRGVDFGVHQDFEQRGRWGRGTVYDTVPARVP